MRRYNMEKNANWGAILLVLMMALAFSASITLGEINIGARDIDLAFGGIQGYLNNTLAVNFNLSGPMNAAGFRINNAVLNNATLVNSSVGQYKIGSFTRDLTVASGTQAITGVGFQPTTVEFLAAIDSTYNMSIGIDDGTTAVAIVNYGCGSPGWFLSRTSGRSIEFQSCGGVEYFGAISSMDSGGFTVTWTRGGSPTGTGTISYIARR